MLLKSLLTSLLAGAPASLFFSLTGSLFAFLGMLALIRLLESRISPIGVSVAGAALHNTGQLVAACLLMQTAAVFAFLPVLLVSAAVTGTLTGIAARIVLRRFTAG
jgi:heptaprenyl diphosphate synthase